MSGGAGRRILLFDIDGTLTDTQGAGSRALKRTFAEALGLEGALDGVSIAGRSDSWIVAAGLRARGRDAPPEAISRFRDAYVGRLEQELDAGEVRLLPGVIALLDALDRRGDAILGLGTGNFRAAGRAKLERVGIAHRFRDGGFGDDAPDRAELLRAGRDRLQALGGSGETVVIGDTRHDIEAARAIGARVVAVRTGYAEPGDLDGADAVFDDLSDADAVVAALIGKTGSGVGGGAGGGMGGG